MPRSKQVEKQDILQAAAEVIREKGEQALTVRSIAARLGCSTQPLYYEFANIEQLRVELLLYVRQRYLQFRCSNYKEFGRHFLNFARQEKELFRFVYLRRRDPGETLLDDINCEETVRLLDFASCGRDGSWYISWLNVRDAPAAIPAEHGGNPIWNNR